MEARGLGLRRYNGRREIGASFRCALPPERIRPSGLELYAFPQQLLGSRLFSPVMRASRWQKKSVSRDHAG